MKIRLFLIAALLGAARSNPADGTVTFGAADILGGSDRAMLNREINANPSTLDGALKANGKVFIINPQRDHRRSRRESRP